MMAHMVDILSEDGAGDTTVAEVHAEVIKRQGVSFGPDHRKHMYEFFHRLLRHGVRKQFFKKDTKRFVAVKKRKKKKKLMVTKFTDAVDAESRWRERLSMWNNDEWMMKYSMMGFAD